MIEDAVQIVLDVYVPDAKHLVTQCVETLGPSLICRDGVRIGMLRTIEFDDETRGFAEKIGNKRTTGRLTSELEPVQATVAQTRSQASLMLGLMGTQ